MPNWALEGVIATSPRPGFKPGPELAVPAGVVEEWLFELEQFGIVSIICLIGEDQLWLYRRSVPEGLINRYRQAGFEVAHIPTLDQQTHPFTPEQYDLAWEHFQRLPKPVLVHCSAGMDRTGRIVRHLKQRMAHADGSAAGA